MYIYALTTDLKLTTLKQLKNKIVYLTENKVQLSISNVFD